MDTTETREDDDGAELRMSKILIIGVTGSLGFDLAISSLRASHPTFGLVRDSAFCDPIKCNKLRILSDSGVTLLKVELLFISPLFFYPTE